jgi:hypothetical protein
MKTVILSIVSLFALSACLKDKTIEPTSEIGSSDTVSFSGEILPEIFNVSCNTTGCHNSATNAGDYILENYSQINSASEILLKVMNHDPEYLAMPLGGEKIADSLIQKFDSWIKQGKLNN